MRMREAPLTWVHTTTTWKWTAMRTAAERRLMSHRRALAACVTTALQKHEALAGSLTAMQHEARESSLAAPQEVLAAAASLAAHRGASAAGRPFSLFARMRSRLKQVALSLAPSAAAHHL